MMGVLVYRYTHTAPKPETLYCEIKQSVDQPGAKLDICAIVKILSTNVMNETEITQMNGEVCASSFSEIGGCSEGGYNYYGKFAAKNGVYCMGYNAKFYNITDTDKTALSNMFEQEGMDYSKMIDLVKGCEIDG